MLPACSLGEASVVANRVREDLAKRLKNSAPFTLSIGLAESEPGDALSDVIERADIALLDAKARGRDRVCVFERLGRFPSASVPSSLDQLPFDL